MPGPNVSPNLPDSVDDDVLVVDTRERGRRRNPRDPSPPRSRAGRGRRRTILLIVGLLVVGWLAS